MSEPPVALDPLPEGVRVRSHPEIRTLLLTSEELTAWLLDQRTGGVRQLNQAAAAVWALIEEPVTLAGLTADLADTFELEPAIAEEVVGAAVDALRAEDLLEITDADGSVIGGGSDADDDDDQMGASGATGANGADRADTATDEARLPELLTRAPDP